MQPSICILLLVVVFTQSADAADELLTIRNAILGTSQPAGPPPYKDADTFGTFPLSLKDQGNYDRQPFLVWMYWEDPAKAPGASGKREYIIEYQRPVSPYTPSHSSSNPNPKSSFTYTVDAYGCVDRVTGIIKRQVTNSPDQFGGSSKVDDITNATPSHSEAVPELVLIEWV